MTQTRNQWLIIVRCGSCRAVGSYRRLRFSRIPLPLRSVTLAGYRWFV